MAFADVQQGTKEADVRGGAAPRSTIPWRDGIFGLAGLTVAWLAVMLLRPDPLAASWLILLATVIPMLQRELRRAPAVGGRPWVLSPLAWLAGFVVATLPFAVIHGQGGGLVTWLVAWGVAAPGFALRLALEALRNGSLSGGFPVVLGQALLSRDLQKLRDLGAPARLWALKAFFIPLYGMSLYVLVRMALALDITEPVAWLGLAVVFLYTIDLTFGFSGYLFASNDLVPTVRSTQRRWLGWVVCLACYGPIIVHWPAFEAVVHAEISWPESAMLSPLTLAGAAAMLVLLVLYVSASVCFGLRFSNLCDRGVLAAGPYRYMKHPAYFAHVANAWIITFIFLPAAGVTLGLPELLVPVAFTVLYRLRSVTEEQHMRENPDYVAYAEWIAQHGLMARLRRMLLRGAVR